jgi:hypothetical protein
MPKPGLAPGGFVSMLQSVVKRVVLAVEWHDGTVRQVEGENLRLDIELDGYPDGGFPGFLDCAILAVSEPPHPELRLAFKWYGHDSRFELVEPGGQNEDR